MKRIKFICLLLVIAGLSSCYPKRPIENYSGGIICEKTRIVGYGVDTRYKMTVKMTVKRESIKTKGGKKYYFTTFYTYPFDFVRYGIGDTIK